MIRAALEHLGVQQSGPAFYQLMARLEDADYVDGWYEQEIVAGQIIRQRHYRITRSGSTARAEIRHFYARAARSLAHG